jgi:hypothetical protein
MTMRSGASAALLERSDGDGMMRDASIELRHGAVRSDPTAEI